MTDSLAPIDIASHWPFVERSLGLDRWTVAKRILAALAMRQVRTDGAPVQLGRSSLVEGGMTPGEAGRASVVLAELERRRVVVRYPGRGRRAHAWSFGPEPMHWRPMPWRWSARAVQEAITGCVCRAGSAVAARCPSQSGALPRGGPEFHLSDADHLWRPGLLPVDTRGNGGARAATAHHPGLFPVDTRGYGGVSAPPVLFVRDRDLSLEEERVAPLVEVIERTTPGVWGRPRARLVKLAATLNDAQIAIVAAAMARVGGPRVDRLVDEAHDAAASPACKAAGRSLSTPLDYGVIGRRVDDVLGDDPAVP